MAERDIEAAELKTAARALPAAIAALLKDAQERAASEASEAEGAAADLT